MITHKIKHLYKKPNVAYGVGQIGLLANVGFWRVVRRRNKNI